MQESWGRGVSGSTGTSLIAVCWGLMKAEWADPCLELAVLITDIIIFIADFS